MILKMLLGGVVLVLALLLAQGITIAFESNHPSDTIPMDSIPTGTIPYTQACGGQPVSYRYLEGC